MAEPWLLTEEEARLVRQRRTGLDIPLVTELVTELRVSAMADVVMAANG
jgi:hypothetical protein